MTKKKIQGPFGLRSGKVGGQKKFGFPSYVFGWRGGKVGEWKIFLFGWREKWEDRKDLVFPHVCLVRGVKKQEGKKLFYLVGEKNERIENIVYIN